MNAPLAASLVALQALIDQVEEANGDTSRRVIKTTQAREALQYVDQLSKAARSAQGYTGRRRAGDELQDPRELHTELSLALDLFDRLPLTSEG